MTWRMEVGREVPASTLTNFQAADRMLPQNSMLSDAPYESDPHKAASAGGESGPHSPVSGGAGSPGPGGGGGGYENAQSDSRPHTRESVGSIGNGMGGSAWAGDDEP